MDKWSQVGSNWVKGNQRWYKYSRRLGDEGLIRKRFGKFWFEVGRGGER